MTWDFKDKTILTGGQQLVFKLTKGRAFFQIYDTTSYIP